MQFNVAPGAFRRVRNAPLNRIRRAWPKRVVSREVQGVHLHLPWSHRLPDYTAAYPSFGQNLVDVAQVIAQREPPFDIIDIGANVGKSALQILKKVDARILCVEGDPYWLPFLERNVGHAPQVTIFPTVLIPKMALGSPLRPIRSGGTTCFVSGAVPDCNVRTADPDMLRSGTSYLDRVRLIKSDVDGWDCRLVPETAKVWREHHPVLFFEYDPRLAKSAGDPNPKEVWKLLGELGYLDVVAWDNYGRPVGAFQVVDMAASEMLEEAVDRGECGYWDVAVTHASDGRVTESLLALVKSG
jgi:FkbM family methyltransferase